MVLMSLFPSSFPWSLELKIHLQNFKANGWNPAFYLKGYFLKCSYFCRNSWRKVSLAVSCFSKICWKIPKSKFKRILNKCRAELTWTYVSDMVETCTDMERCLLHCWILKAHYVKITYVYLYSCLCIHLEVCIPDVDTSELLSNEWASWRPTFCGLYFWVLEYWQRAYTTTLIIKVF